MTGRPNPAKQTYHEIGCPGLLTRRLAYLFPRSPSLVPLVTGRSYSACDSIRFLTGRPAEIPPTFAPRRLRPPTRDLYMDEEDGRPGARSRQLGPSSAPSGVALQSLFQPRSGQNPRATSFRVFCERVGNLSYFEQLRGWRIAARAKAQNVNGRFFGTTEVVPCYKAPTESTSAPTADTSEQAALSYRLLATGCSLSAVYCLLLAICC